MLSEALVEFIRSDPDLAVLRGPYNFDDAFPFTRTSEPFQSFPDAFQGVLPHLSRRLLRQARIGQLSLSLAKDFSCRLENAEKGYLGRQSARAV